MAQRPVDVALDRPRLQPALDESGGIPSDADRRALLALIIPAFFHAQQGWSPEVVGDYTLSDRRVGTTPMTLLAREGRAFPRWGLGGWIVPDGEVADERDWQALHREREVLITTLVDRAVAAALSPGPEAAEALLSACGVPYQRAVDHPSTALPDAITRSPYAYLGAEFELGQRASTIRTAASSLAYHALQAYADLIERVIAHLNLPPGPRRSEAIAEGYWIGYGPRGGLVIHDGKELLVDRADYSHPLPSPERQAAFFLACLPTVARLRKHAEPHRQLPIVDAFRRWVTTPSVLG